MRREGYQAYGARRITECLCALSERMASGVPADIQGVRAALDAAHRLQTCLTLFARGYPTPRVALWKRRLRRILRALYALHDCLRLIEWVAAQQPASEHRAGVQRALLRLQQHSERQRQTLQRAWERWNAQHIPSEIRGLSRRWIESFGDEAVDPAYAQRVWQLFRREQLAALEAGAATPAVPCGRARALLDACDLLAPLNLPLDCPNDLQARLETLDALRFREGSLRLLTELLDAERAREQAHTGNLRAFTRIQKGWVWLVGQFQRFSA
ncbi:MAG: hypothetical protein WHS44_08235 [Fimbriimonadales bacterium]|nr:MAG: hypothetical protein KatS3mg018_0475 [Fimbriimonadales bacterium]